MTNFVFKSQGTFKKISNQLDIIQSELRHQRSDMAHIIRLLHVYEVENDIQKQANSYYQGKLDEPLPETDQLGNKLVD